MGVCRGEYRGWELRHFREDEKSGADGGSTRAGGELRLEGDASDEGAGTLAVGSREHVHGAEAAGVEADVGA